MVFMIVVHGVFQNNFLFKNTSKLFLKFFYFILTSSYLSNKKTLNKY